MLSKVSKQDLGVLIGSCPPSLSPCQSGRRILATKLELENTTTCQSRENLQAILWIGLLFEIHCNTDSDLCKRRQEQENTSPSSYCLEHVALATTNADLRVMRRVQSVDLAWWDSLFLVRRWCNRPWQEWCFQVQLSNRGGKTQREATIRIVRHGTFCCLNVFVRVEVKSTNRLCCWVCMC